MALLIGSLLNNMENHPEIVKCEVLNCGKILSSKYNLKRHIESCHKGNKRFECKICFKRFSSKQNKREHIRLEHSYSFDSQRNVERDQGCTREIIRVPKLSDLVLKCLDPDLRPLSKKVKMFMYADILEKVEVPVIGDERKIQFDGMNLAGVESILNQVN